MLSSSCNGRKDWLILLFAVAAATGCGQEAKVGRVHGTVRLDGKPLATGIVRFIPDAGRAANGKIQSDGTYSLGTFSQADGAILGPHKVAIIANEAGGDDRPAYEHVNQKTRALVPERYMAIGTSGLTFEVKPGDNQADFDLKSGR
jgi:hypothetical protein